MLIPRVIPCLLMDNGEFVKTRKFKKPIYVGDPVNVINLFNRFEVDEIVLLDIRATLAKRPPDFALIEQLASECWVPLAYGGGIRSMADIERIFTIGVEKVVLNTIVSETSELVRQAADRFGSQAIVVSIDVKPPLFGKPDCWTASGTQRLKRSPVEQARYVELLGAGEILLTSIERDGEMNGYDLELIEAVSKAVSIPVVACGGAGTRDDLPKPIAQARASAVAAGSLFVFQSRERGVLINFPERDVLESLMQSPTTMSAVE
jgi:cyclase